MHDYATPQEEELMGFLETISKIDNYLKTAIHEFDNYYRILEKFEEKIRTLVMYSKELRKNYTPERLETVKKYVKEIATIVFPRFRNIMEKEVKYNEEMSMLVSQEIQIAPLKKNIFLTI